MPYKSWFLRQIAASYTLYFLLHASFTCDGRTEVDAGYFRNLGVSCAIVLPWLGRVCELPIEQIRLFSRIYAYGIYC